MALMVGVNVGWLSPTIGRLSRPDPPFEATKAQTTWLPAIFSINQAVGAMTATLTTRLIGSKQVVYLCGFYFLIGWSILIYAKAIELVFLSLVCNGMGMGALFSAYPLYIGEMSNPKIRGKLVSFVVHGLMVGSSVGNAMGAAIDPWVYALVNLVPNVMFLATFPFIPNTPHHLIRCNKTDEAAKSVEWYTRNIDSYKEVESLSRFLASSPQLPLIKTIKELKIPVNFKTLVVLNILFILIHLGGVYTLMVYFEIILIDAKVDAMSPATLVTIITTLGIPATWAALYTSDKFGRTTILLWSCISIAITSTAMGIHFQLLDLGYIDPNLQWITIISIAIYRSTLSIGIFTIIPTLMGEMFAPNVKSLCCSISLIMNSISTFVSQKYFVFLVECLTYKYVFYILAVVHLLLGIYAIRIIPETKGKSLQEIQALLNKTQLPEETNLMAVKVGKSKSDISI